MTDSYNINTDVRFGPLEKIDVRGIADACKEPWWNQTLCKINESVIRLGVIQGEFHWHHHDEEDEFFYVLEGELLIDLKNETVRLGPGDGFSVPKKVEHRTRAPQRTVILMVEPATVVPTGD